MKFVIVVVLLAAVVGTYGQTSIRAKAGANAAIGGGQKATAAADVAQLYKVLTRILGPKLAGAVSKLIFILTKNPLLRSIGRAAVRILINLLKKAGITEKLVSGGNTNAANEATQANGKSTNLPPATQQQLDAILQRTVGPYTAPYVVTLVALLVNGKIAGKIPLEKIIALVTKAANYLLKTNALLGKLLGQKGLGKPISQLLGAPGKILGAL